MKNKLIGMAILLILTVACQDNDDVNIKPVAAFKVGTTTIEVGQSIYFTDLSFDEDGSIVKWQWDFGNGASSEEENPSVVYNEAGEYKVVLTVWDNNSIQNENAFDKTIIVKEKSLSNEKPEIIWEFQTPCGFQDVSPAIDDNGNVIVGCDANAGRGGKSIWVIKDGEEVWYNQYNEVVRSSPAVADDGTIYIGGYRKKDDTHNLCAFSSKSSTPISTFDLKAHAKYSSPAIDQDGTVYFSTNKKLYAIHAAPAMAEKWSADCGGDTQSTPVIGSDAVYVCSNSGKLYAFDKNTGKQKWATDYGKSCSSVPAIGDDGTIYICGETNDGGVIMAVNKDGSVKWQTNSVSAFSNSGISLSTEGHLYVGNSDGEMLCCAQEDGAIIWKFMAQAKIRSVPAVDNNGNIYFGDGKGVFYVLNSNGKPTYKEIKLGTNIWSSPVIDKNGIIYVCADMTKSSEPGKVFALRTNATGAQKTWSMRSGNYKRNAHQ
ncbi:outer membrane protein assembly factor BamB family protein [Bacteroides stercorirosoris]|uniref:Outer membrane protein assembly factor BamB, contains PQQ-like beta-propeller repeat n=1 Tax=Bacteroides stercorirosoris TaxID=871324 RepID=A0A1M6HS00_9BACE|nr:PQQ-binding-like beta-propeller repeat protein [Bacteroides stercorirosoris]SHJ24972.1 Outer membrane protein assembly factor BamB, contains PQQ-like beta-propeller repeat [Bacteroides stercorirosoris]